MECITLKLNSYDWILYCTYPSCSICSFYGWSYRLFNWYILEDINMSMQICKEAYQELIDGDIEWLLRQPRDLERDHIEAVLRKSVELLYGKEE